MTFDIVNPKTNERSQIELDLSAAVMNAALYDIAVAEFVTDLVREKLPPNFILIGTDFRTP
jgi:hypothetical protein